MKIEIITIGDEIMCGDIVDTNFSWLAERLWFTGYNLHWHSSVADRPEDMKAAFLTALRSDLVIVTGGLGPTSDDRTLEVAADAFGRKMIEDPAALADIERRLKELGRETNPAQRKQAMHPEGGIVFPNVEGTAPGCRLEHEGTQFIFLVGVPSEMYKQWERDVWPFLESLQKTPMVYDQRVFRCFGAAEAELEEKLKGISLDGVRLSFRIRFPEILIKTACWSKSAEEVSQALENTEHEIRSRIGPNIYATGDNPIEKLIGDLLKKRQETLAVAESCTGGYLSNLLTDVPGASAYFNRGLVTYANEAKKELVDVEVASLDEYGAVSDAVAREMAEGVRDRARTTYGISITGIAGPGGGTDEKPVGTVHMALATPTETLQKKYLFPFGRLHFKQIASHAALHKLRRYIQAL